jgi:hypothetical protein
MSTGSEYSVWQLMASISLTAALSFCGFYVRSLLTRVNEANQQLATLRTEVFGTIEKLRTDEESRCVRCRSGQYDFEKDVLQRISRLEEKVGMLKK